MATDVGARGARGAAANGWIRTRAKRRMRTRRPGMNASGTPCTAMLTTAVNIAVFATFSIVIGHASRVKAAFKPVCAI